MQIYIYNFPASYANKKYILNINIIFSKLNIR